MAASRTSPAVQWLRLPTFTAGVWVLFLFGELRSRIPRSQKKMLKRWLLHEGTPEAPGDEAQSGCRPGRKTDMSQHGPPDAGNTRQTAEP